MNKGSYNWGIWWDENVNLWDILVQLSINNVQTTIKHEYSCIYISTPTSVNI